MAEPTLSEINSFRADPELAKGELIPVFDNRDAIRNAMDSVKNYADNMHRQYAEHQKNVAQFFQNVNLDTTGIMPEDREQLQRETANFYAELIKDPAVLGNPYKNPQAYAKINQTQGKLQNLIAKSKQDYLYGQAQEKFRQQHPELINPKNEQIKKQWASTPLEQRRAYNWDLPIHVDTQKLAEGTLGAIGKAYTTPSEIEMVPVMDDQGMPLIDPATKKPKLRSSGYFLDEKGIAYDKGRYDNIWSDYLKSDVPVDAYGHTAAQAAESLFNNLSNIEKQNYLNKSAKTGKSPIEEMWKDVGAAYYKDKDVKETKRTEDKFAMERQKYLNDLDQMKIKFGYDKALKEMEKALDLSNNKSLEQFKFSLKGKDASEQYEFLNSFIDGLEMDARGKRPLPYKTSFGETKNQYTMKVSPKILDLFSQQNPNDSKSRISPDQLRLNEDGTVQALFFKRDDSGKQIQGDGYSGQPVDSDLSKIFTKDEFKAVVGKELLGVQGLNKSLDNKDDTFEPKIQVETLRKKYNY